VMFPREDRVRVGSRSWEGQRMYPLGVAACVDIGYVGLIGNRVMTGVHVEDRDVEVGSLVR
jgi:hypothetical protein